MANNDEKVGKPATWDTKVVDECLFPVWDEEFVVQVPAERRGARRVEVFSGRA